MKRERVIVGAWVFGPPAVALLVVALGDLGALGWPPPPTRWLAWSAATGPALAVAAIARALALATCGITMLRVGVTIVTAALGDPSMSLRPSVAPRSLRRALGRLARPTAVAGLGVGLASATLVAGGAAAALAPSGGARPVPAATAMPRDDDGQHGGPVPPDSSAASSYAEMRRVQLVLAPFTDTRTGCDSEEVWVVERGDHLWSIAHETLAEHLGRAPSERRTAAYWRRLIDANRDRLAIPDEPDVILPGQRLVLPQPAPARGQRSGT